MKGRTIYMNNTDTTLIINNLNNFFIDLNANSLKKNMKRKQNRMPNEVEKRMNIIYKDKQLLNRA